MGRKVSGKFAIRICTLHHRELHRRGNEHGAKGSIPPMGQDARGRPR
jgi:hypothetical protein